MSKQNQALTLPVIPLPTFDRKIINWRAFIDAFDALIHINAELNEVQKLIYLKQSLKNEPHELINSLDTVCANYPIARELLTKKYDNTRKIINDHVIQILNLPSTQKESSSTLNELIIDLQTNLNCLKSLEHRQMGCITRTNYFAKTRPHNN